MPWHLQQVSELILKQTEALTFHTLIDCTAHIGCDTILFRKLFSHLSIFAIEYDKTCYDLLNQNIDKLPMILNKPNVVPIVTLHLDCIDYLNTQPDLKGQMVYFDPPWGQDYKNNKVMELYLSTQPLTTIVTDVLIKQPTLIIVKLPTNYDFSLWKNIKYQLYPIYTPSNKVSYLLAFTK